ncbi:MAG: hypothetical protein MZW92_52260 [Comamonadaceae bacterium]|nr:hypothetical protein [Comamonadaceae bacterium]
MDVVASTNIQKLNGSIEHPLGAGQGHACGDHLLPLTLAILQVLLVRAGRAALRRPAVDGTRNPANRAACRCRRWEDGPRWWCAARCCRLIRCPSARVGPAIGRRSMAC